MVRAALIALAVAAGAPDPAQQFNLLCTGTMTTLTLAGKAEEPYTRVFRVDLAAQQWCADECTSVEPIKRIEPGRLVLIDDDRSDLRPDRINRETLNRVTGDHSSHYQNGPVGPVYRSVFRAGRCERAPFTAFVSGETKF